MASAFSHAIVAVAIGKCIQPERAPSWYWALGILLAIAPDLDVIGFHFGIAYGDMLGHRGLSHSLLFAAALALVIAAALLRQHQVGFARLYFYLFLATASHGVLDSLTNGGLGVAFFSPLSNERYFFDFRPIEVSPIGVGCFFSERGLAVIRSEALWLWLPSAILFAAATAMQYFRKTR